MGLSRSLLAAGAVAVCALALGGCPTVSLGETPPDIGLCEPAGGLDYFNTVMWPSYLTAQSTLQNHTCVDGGCHGHDSFSGGFGLDETNPLSPGNYRAAQGELLCSAPDQSKLLIKPFGLTGHGGNALFRMSDPQYQDFLDWFQ
ncbi:MAG TPA: hypothetical protein VGF94_08635 [Kofleriaceae bacterium]|jgi:hypothetical protein